MPPLPANLQFYALILTGMMIGALCGIVPLFIACYSFLQRFATKQELKALEERALAQAREAAIEIKEVEGRLSTIIISNRTSSEHSLGQIGGQIAALTSTMQLWIQQTERSTGHLEGKVEIMKELTKVHLEHPSTAP